MACIRHHLHYTHQLVPFTQPRVKLILTSSYSPRRPSIGSRHTSPSPHSYYPCATIVRSLFESWHGDSQSMSSIHHWSGAISLSCRLASAWFPPSPDAVRGRSAKGEGLWRRWSYPRCAMVRFSLSAAQYACAGSSSECMRATVAVAPHRGDSFMVSSTCLSACRLS